VAGYLRKALIAGELLEDILKCLAMIVDILEFLATNMMVSTFVLECCRWCREAFY